MNRKSTVVAGAAALLLALTACSGSTDTPRDGGDTSPIKVGSVNALSGPAIFPEASEAAQAVFDRFNEAGGLDGRPIEYTILDDKADPATAAASAREVVESNESVALVGSASLLDCEINGEYYVQQDILSIQGTGVDQVCFDNPNISPVNVGPFGDTTMTLTYGSEELGLEKICGLLEVTGGTQPAYEAAIAEWSEITGKELVYLDDTVPYGGSDYTPYIVRAKEAGCDAVYSNAVEPDGIGQIKAAEAQGWSDVTFLYLTSVYSEQFATAVGEAGNGVSVPAEFAPFTDDTLEANADWRALMEDNDISLTSFSQGGYLAATYFIEVLEGIDGDITREAVNEALRGMTTPIENGMVGTPWIFGDGETHNSNRAGWPVKLESNAGAWATAADDWFLLD
ncbi:ABC transporter substrate-binding protein [Microbacterium invictum]|uniref:Branched-chain amino acid transport system substrate-binding protein n=1 Tax=Microbacterium invictum TaxID=515415 RepID=A0AA40VNZ2_9MICO|nr:MULTISPECIES: ABC transporter substrate-binding protein [Microbacterium]MBB4141317.1 branched-chain amino acid transport system substrate-binding protein [Microbacterium invictum]